MLRQLEETVHKQPIRFHSFICLKLMIPVQGRLLSKMANLLVYVPPEEQFWPSSMKEFFVLGFIYPFIAHIPWRLRVTPKVLRLVIKVSFLLRESPGYTGSVLCQLRTLTKRVASMSGVLAWVLILR